MKDAPMEFLFKIMMINIWSCQIYCCNEVLHSSLTFLLEVDMRQSLSSYFIYSENSTNENFPRNHLHHIQHWFASMIVLIYALTLLQFFRQIHLMMLWRFSSRCIQFSNYHSIRKVEQFDCSIQYCTVTNVFCLIPFAIW